MFILLAACGIAVWQLTRSPDLTITGQLRLNDGRTHFHNAAHAKAPAASPTSVEGAQIVVTDGTGKTVAVRSLGEGKGTSGSNDCIFPFTMHARGGLGFYGIDVGPPRPAAVAEADLARPLVLTLGRG